MITATIKTLAQHKTIIVLAHRLSTIEGADIIYVLKDGRISQSGSFAQLSGQAGEFYNLYIRGVKDEV